ncbi:MAG: biopolymer transporter ExbD, partial [Pseudomonadota bacterium]|nr:biopolymer transporter ExbD [Pseudomonadota bacterium]
LIIFFMLATRFDDPRTLILDTSTTQTVDPAHDHAAVLEIAGERLRLDDREMTLPQLRDVLTTLSRQPGPGLHIRVAPHTPLQSLAEVLDLAAQAQLARVTVTRITGPHPS